MNNPTNENKTIEEGKTIALVAYLTIIGLIVAFVLNNDKKNSFATYHIRQSLGLALLAVVIMVLGFIPYIGWIISMLGTFILIALWVLGIINAANGQEKTLPIVGEKFAEWFKNI